MRLQWVPIQKPTGSKGCPAPTEAKAQRICACPRSLPFPLKAHLGAVHQQPDKTLALERGERIVCSGELLQSAVDRRVAHRLTPDALDFPGRPPVGDMGTKTDAGLKGLIQEPHLLRDRQRPDQGGQAAAGVTILQLGEAIREVAHRTAELPRRALVAVSAIALRILLQIPLHQLGFDCLQKRGHNRRMDLGGRLLQAQHHTIDCQPRAWYRDHQAKIHRDLALRIPPFLMVYPNPRKRNPFCFASF